MNAAAVTGVTSRLRAAGSTADVPATVTVNAAGTLATLTPSSPLAAGTVYTATVAAAVTDTSGTALGAESLRSHTSTLATSATPKAPAPCTNGEPLHTGVPLTPPFFFFNDTATTETYTLSLPDALPISGSTADVPATVTVNAAGTLATLTPSSPLAAGTVYTATVAAAVTDTSGTALGA